MESGNSQWRIMNEDKIKIGNLMEITSDLHDRDWRLKDRKLEIIGWFTGPWETRTVQSDLVNLTSIVQIGE